MFTEVPDGQGSGVGVTVVTVLLVAVVAVVGVAVISVTRAHREHYTQYSCRCYSEKIVQIKTTTDSCHIAHNNA